MIAAPLAGFRAVALPNNQGRSQGKSLGDRATQRLIGLVNSGEVTLVTIDRDEGSYGRKFRIVKVDGESVCETLVDDGLARWYRGGRRLRR